jgi:hypothetical protein
MDLTRKRNAALCAELAPVPIVSCIFRAAHLAFAPPYRFHNIARTRTTCKQQAGWTSEWTCTVSLTVFGPILEESRSRRTDSNSISIGLSLQRGSYLGKRGANRSDKYNGCLYFLRKAVGASLILDGNIGTRILCTLFTDAAPTSSTVHSRGS